MNPLIRSLQLDSEFIQLPLSVWEKTDFILKKYLLIIKNYLFGFKIGASHIKILGQNYYYYDKFGIAFLESVMTESRDLLPYVKPEATIIDIGAHVGEFHVFCKKILNAKNLISIEPIRESYLLLQKNITQKPLNFAISTKKMVNMYTPDTTIMSSPLKVKPYRKMEKCRGIYLDNLPEIRRLKNIDLVKIDVEGAEYDVLKTAKKTLQKTKYLFVEASIQRPAFGDLFDTLRVIKTYCPQSEIVNVGKPFTVSRKRPCVDLLIKCT